MIFLKITTFRKIVICLGNCDFSESSYRCLAKVQGAEGPPGPVIAEHRDKDKGNLVTKVGGPIIFTEIYLKKSQREGREDHGTLKQLGISP